MQTIRDPELLRIARCSLVGTVAFVPTMGALHAGHMALIEQARGLADQVVVSIFVNPLQFGRNDDLARYPRQEAQDIALLEGAGVAILWLPDVSTMYPDGFATTVRVAGLADHLEGAHRPGHFDGVATVVARLFGQIRPEIAIFGEKDWQQLAIIRRMTGDLALGVTIISVATEREADGLARSSRNAYLSPTARAAARAMPDALKHAKIAIEAGQDVAAALEIARETLRAAGFSVDYVELVDAALMPLTALTGEGRLVAAARIGTTRLIDNIAVCFAP